MKTSILDKGYVELKGSFGNDLDPVIAARISTGNPTGVNESDDDRLRDYLYRHQHVSCFEYNILKVEVKVPIFVSRQIIRHRTLDIHDVSEGIPANIAVNEYSGRYAELINECYIPEFERVMGESKTNKQGSEQELSDEVREEFVSLCEFTEEEFKKDFGRSREIGVAKELARINAPVSNYTVLLLQGNLRNWFHFINLRIKPNAQYEVRVVAEAILEMIKELWPKCYESFVEHTLNAETFSATDMKVIREWDKVSKHLTKKSEEVFDRICSNEGLNKSRIRELKHKLQFEFEV